MKEPEIRKLDVFLETILFSEGKVLDKPLLKCAVAVVIKNPLAGSYQENLDELSEYGEYLGGYLTKKAIEKMHIDAEEIESFGKACIVGVNGEHEHAAALLHPPLGAPMREALHGGKAIIPSAKKIAAAGATLDVPLLHKNAMLVKSHYDAITIRIPDAPRPDEIVVAVAFANGGRPNARVGGIKASEIKCINGLD